MIYVAFILFTALFLLYQKEQYNDLLSNKKTGIEKNKWKVYGWCMKALLIVAIFCSQFVSTAWQDCFLSGVIGWVLFEFGYNKIVLNVDWFYVGRSSIQDNRLGKYKWLAMAVFLIGAILIKIYVG